MRPATRATTKREQQPPPIERRDISERVQTAAKSSLAELKIEAMQRVRKNRIDFPLHSTGDAVRALAQLFSDRELQMQAMGFGPKAAREHAEDAWREALPELTNKHTALIYIAAVAWGMRTRILKTDEAKLMIFLAQTQLTVLRMDTTPPLRDGTLAQTADERQLPLLPQPGNEASQ